jgi:hypothetical protein
MCTYGMYTYGMYTYGMYSRVPNKRTGRLLENEKKSHLYALFGTIRLLIFRKNSHLYVYSRLYFYSFLYFYCYRKVIAATFFMNSTIICDPNPMHYEF